VQAAVRWLTVVSLQTAVGVVFAFQRSYSTCRAGNETKTCIFLDMARTKMKAFFLVYKIGNLPAVYDPVLTFFIHIIKTTTITTKNGLHVYNIEVNLF